MSNRPPARILIIDNDEDVVRAIATRLEGLGYGCLTAGTGGQGLGIFAESEVDLVITDLNMPGGDGIALVESIRMTSDVPIIVVTGFSGEYADRLRGLPGVTRVSKPFETEALVDLVDAEVALC